MTSKDTTYNFKENSIYEFDSEFNLRKERYDKNKAKSNFTYGNNPLYRIIEGKG